MIAQLQSRFFDILAGKDTDLKVKRLVNLLDDVNRLKEHNPSGELNNFIKSIEMSLKAYERVV